MSSTQHTAGPLVVGDDSKWGGDPVFIGSDFTTEKVATVTVADQNGFQRAEANARRLVACWNAFDGIDIELIEGGTSAAMLIADERRRMQPLVDALAKTETYLQERLAATNGTGATKILPMIRAALAGAQVAPTQSTWADC